MVVCGRGYYMRRRRIWERGVDLRAYAWADVWYVQMRMGNVCARCSFSFAVCVVFHMFVFRRKEYEGEGQQQRACEDMSVGASACDEKMRKAIDFSISR